MYKYCNRQRLQSKDEFGRVTCPVCGKLFILNTLSIYKCLGRKDRRTYHMCGYTCYNLFENNNDK